MGSRRRTPRRPPHPPVREGHRSARKEAVQGSAARLDPCPLPARWHIHTRDSLFEDEEV